MSAEMTPRVEDFVASPGEGRGTIELIVQIDADHVPETLDDLRELGVDVLDRELPLDCVLVETPRNVVHELADLPHVERLEKNTDLEELGSGN